MNWQDVIGYLVFILLGVIMFLLNHAWGAQGYRN